MTIKLVILDRDGVVNFDSANYIKSDFEWQPIPGSLEAISSLCQAGIKVALATNQSGLARELFSLSELHKMHLKMQRLLAEFGGWLDYISFCPHHPNDVCLCRKPKPGMLFRIQQQLHVSLSCACMVGDSLRDIQAAQAAGCAACYLVKTGNGEKVLAQNVELDGVQVFSDLSAVVANLLESQ